MDKNVLSKVWAGWAILVFTACASAELVAANLDVPTEPNSIEQSHFEYVEPEFEKAQALMATPKIAQVFDSVRSNRERDNSWLIDLNLIAAPPFMESKRAERVKGLLEELGLTDVSIDDVGNVVARRPGTVGDKTIALVAHIDTVFPPWMDVEVKRDGDLFTAPGVGDNTRGVVVLLSLVDALQKHEIETEQDVLFIGSVGEEGLGDLRGVRHLFGDGDTGIDRFIAIDGGQPERLVTSAVGSLRYKVTFSGPGGHSYGAFGRAHPHQALAQAIALFTEKAEPTTQTEGAKATFSVGRIGGGTSINSIPFESWLEVDMRSVDPEKLGELDEAFRAAVADALAIENDRRHSEAAMTVEIKLLGNRPAGEGDTSSSLVKNAIAALLTMGVTPELRPSSTDSNIPISLGIPAVTISRGGISRNTHAPSESWEDVNGYKAIQTALLMVLLEAGYAP